MTSPMLKAVDRLNNRLVHAEALAQALDMAGGENPPPWVYVFREQIAGITEASDALESLIRGGSHVLTD